MGLQSLLELYYALCVVYLLRGVFSYRLQMPRYLLWQTQIYIVYQCLFNSCPEPNPFVTCREQIISVQAIRGVYRSKESIIRGCQCSYRVFIRFARRCPDLRWCLSGQTAKGVWLRDVWWITSNSVLLTASQHCPLYMYVIQIRTDFSPCVSYVSVFT